MSDDDAMEAVLPTARLVCRRAFSKLGRQPPDHAGAFHDVATAMAALFELGFRLGRAQAVGLGEGKVETLGEEGVEVVRL